MLPVLQKWFYPEVELSIRDGMLEFNAERSYTVKSPFHNSSK
jgi:hypothetical protein